MSVTLVTGLWNIGRSSLEEGWNRSFEDYLSSLKSLLKTPDNIIIYIEAEYESFIWENRSKENTQVIVRELDWFRANETIYNKVQEIRQKPS
jgi:hypothetical protein